MKIEEKTGIQNVRIAEKVVKAEVVGMTGLAETADETADAKSFRGVFSRGQLPRFWFSVCWAAADTCWRSGECSAD